MSNEELEKKLLELENRLDILENGIKQLNKDRDDAEETIATVLDIILTAIHTKVVGTSDE